MVANAKKRKELMERIIDLSESVEDREVDPFEVEVSEFLERLSESFSEKDEPEDLLMDVQAILGLTDVISQQEEWIKHKSSLLHFDPMLVNWKVKGLTNKQLAYVLVNSWHPTVEMECISRPGIKEAIDYWENLAPLDERRAELNTEEVSPGEISMEEFSELGLGSKEDFDEMVEDAWGGLKESAGENNQISYWEFIDSDDFRETVKNAWLTSFLISYGYATIEIEPLEEKITIKVKEGKDTPTEKNGTSVPIAVSYEDWKERREEDA